MVACSPGKSLNRIFGFTINSIPAESSLSAKSLKLFQSRTQPKWGTGTEMSSTIEVVLFLGLKPVLVDVNLETFNIDINELTKAINFKTKDNYNFCNKNYE